MGAADFAAQRAPGLNPRHARFVAEYAATGNGTRAYQAVYGTEDPNVAASNAWRLLRSEKVRAAVEAIKSRAAEAAEVSVERVLRELAVLGLAPLEAALPVPHVLSAKLKALEILGKHMGLFSHAEEAGATGGFTEKIERALARLRAQQRSQAVAG